MENITIETYIQKYGIKQLEFILTEKGRKRVKYPNWIISDVRFPNECQAIKDRGGIVVRVDRPRHIPTGTEGLYIDLDRARTNSEIIDYSTHESETALDDYKFDYVIENDSDISSLIEKVREMLSHFKLI